VDDMYEFKVVVDIRICVYTDDIKLQWQLDWKDIRSDMMYECKVVGLHN
jgi:hypothetical protein